MEKDCVWLLSNLWKAGLLFPPKIPLPDTLLTDSASVTGLKWLFTDKRGSLKRKTQDHCSFDQVLRRFTSTSPRDSIVASLITRNDFRPLTAFQFEDYFRQGPMPVSSALQMMQNGNGDKTWRYVLTVKVEEGKPHFKYESVRLLDGKRTSSTLTAPTICLHLRDIEKEVRTSIESHSKLKIIHMKLVFLPDTERGVWLLGSEMCVVEGADTLTRNLLQNDDNRPRLRTSSSVRKPPRSTRKEWMEQPSISSQASTHLGIHRRATCPGDFCTCVLSVPQALRKNEADVDELLTRIKRVNSTDGHKETANFKLGLAADYLLKEREKLHGEQRGSSMSTRYILLGKKLLSREGIFPQDNCELDLTNLLRHTDVLSELCEEPQISAFHFYSEVQVCDRCYAVYNLIRGAAMKSSRPRLKSATPKRQKTASPVEARTEHCYVSPLGRIHKHSLNDMLVDLAHHRAENDAPNRLKSQLLEMYKGMTLESGKRVEEMRKMEEERLQPLLDSKLVAPGSVEEMSRKLFPASSRQGLSVQPAAERNLTQWKTFLQRRRRQSRDVG